MSMRLRLLFEISLHFLTEVYSHRDFLCSDDTTGLGGLALKVARRDTLAMRLQERASREELESRNIIPSPHKSDDGKDEVKINLTRYVIGRPYSTLIVSHSNAKTQRGVTDAV